MNIMEYLSDMISLTMSWLHALLPQSVASFVSVHHSEFATGAIWLGLAGSTLAVIVPMLMLRATRVPVFLLLGAPRSGRTAIFNRLVNNTWKPSSTAKGSGNKLGTEAAAVAAPAFKTLEILKQGTVVATAGIIDTQGSVIMTQATSAKLRKASGVVFVVDSSDAMAPVAQGLFRLLTSQALAERRDPLPILLAFNKMDIMPEGGVRFHLGEAVAAIEGIIDKLRQQRDPTEPTPPLGLPDEPFHFAHTRHPLSVARVSAKAGDVAAVPLFLLDVLGGKLSKTTKLQALKRGVLDVLTFRPLTASARAPVSSTPGSAQSKAASAPLDGLLGTH